MTYLRTALTTLVLLGLCVGYAASQMAVIGGRFAEHAGRMDNPRISAVSGIVLLLMIVFALWRDRTETTQP